MRGLNENKILFLKSCCFFLFLSSKYDFNDSLLSYHFLELDLYLFF